MAAPKQFLNKSNNKPPYNKGKPNNRFDNRRAQQGPRRNERISATEIRAVGPKGEQLGIMKTSEALEVAKKLELDLVEIAATANPPVCKIIDYGKYLYEESKKQKSQKQAATKLKEVKLRPHIDEHDFMVKTRRAEMFLFNGNKLKITLMFRPRELGHAEFGYEAVNRIVKMLEHVGTLDNQPKLMGRSITVMMSPVASAKRKLVYNTSPIDDEDFEDEELDEIDDDNENE